MNRRETTIISVFGYEILDSRGNPTVAAVVRLADGEEGRAFVPSGASTGEYEAVELRDDNPDRYNGQGVTRAVENINSKIGPSIEGLDATHQTELDGHLCELDGTSDKRALGANAILGVSLAAARAVAESRGFALYQYLYLLYTQEHGELELGMPQPALNIINGGEHADSGLDVQEFMIIPQYAEMARNMRMASETYHALKGLLDVRGAHTAVGDEGGFAPRLESPEEAFDSILEAIEHADYRAGDECVLGIDVAASELYLEETGRYQFQGDEVTAATLGETYNAWFNAYPLQTIEDPFSEDDLSAWNSLFGNLPANGALVGDDLLVTNEDRIRMGIHKQLANTLLVKPNQVGTLSETLAAISLVYQEGWDIMVSHRSGETSDTFIADLAVAVGARWIKSGAPARGERTAKYNRLLEIEYHGLQKPNLTI